MDPWFADAYLRDPLHPRNESIAGQRLARYDGWPSGADAVLDRLAHNAHIFISAGNPCEVTSEAHVPKEERNAGAAVRNHSQVFQGPEIYRVWTAGPCKSSEGPRKQLRPARIYADNSRECSRRGNRGDPMPIDLRRSVMRKSVMDDQELSER
jgi:hypothetical protein